MSPSLHLLKHTFNICAAICLLLNEMLDCDDSTRNILRTD